MENYRYGEKKISRLHQSIEGLLLACVILGMYAVSLYPLTKPLSIPLFISLVVIFLGAHMVQVIRKKEELFRLQSKTFTVVVFMLFSGTLLGIGNTGWFSSPFFFWLYIMCLALAFLFSTSVSFSFLLVVIGLLLPTLTGSGTLFHVDILFIVFFIGIIPLSYILRRAYLRRIQQEKRILILQKGNTSSDNKVRDVLSNVVIRAASDMREPLNDIRQMALYCIRPTLKPETRDMYLRRIIAASEQALSHLKDFEEETTGKVLVKNPSKLL